MASHDLYDEFPYKSLPIEWTAPERLGLVSMLHGGPRPPLDSFRVLELGCGNGANLIPQAFYRRCGVFVGLDSARSQIDIAESRRRRLDLSNLQFLHADLRDADDVLEGEFDYVVAHGVFSWVPQRVRDALLRLCANRLRRGGILYLNYNANPGWKVRGMVREFLLAHTAGLDGLKARAEAAQAVAARVVSIVPAHDHPYSTLIANEFKFVCEIDASYIAHEYLAPENQAYWRSEFLALLRHHGFEFVADADFNYNSGRLPEGIDLTLAEQEIAGRCVEDTLDLFCYRQLHSPILTKSPLTRELPTLESFGALFVASSLTPSRQDREGSATFQHSSGYEVEAKETSVKEALNCLHRIWPRGVRVDDLFPDVERVKEDLRLLHRSGLIELRLIDYVDLEVDPGPLAAMEVEWGGYFTTRYHTCEAVASIDPEHAAGR